MSEQAKAIYRNDPQAKDIRDDWRQPVKIIQPVFNEQVGRQLGITRLELATAMQQGFEGTQVGTYRDGIRLLPDGRPMEFVVESIGRSLSCLLHVACETTVKRSQMVAMGRRPTGQFR